MNNFHIIYNHIFNNLLLLSIVAIFYDSQQLLQNSTSFFWVSIVKNAFKRVNVSKFVPRYPAFNMKVFLLILGISYLWTMPYSVTELDLVLNFYIFNYNRPSWKLFYLIYIIQHCTLMLLIHIRVLGLYLRRRRDSK